MFNRSEALDLNLSSWAPASTVLTLQAGVSQVQDPARAVEACATTGGEFAGLCLFRAADATLALFCSVLQDERDPSCTPRAIDGNGAYHNVSCPP